MLALALLSALLLGQDVKRDLVYRTVDGEPVKLDLYLPAKRVQTPTPVVVLIHGGAWISGRREDMAPYASALSERGVVVANIDYRLAPKHHWPAMIVDCQEAVRYLWTVASEYALDTGRIGAVGGSAGGHLALLLGFTDGWGPGIAGRSTRVQAVLNFFGPTDLTQDFDKTLATMVSTQVIGKTYEESKADAVAMSPVTYVDSKSAPVYTVHGTADSLVPPKQADRLDEALKKAGRMHVKVMVEGMGHGLASQDKAVDERIKAETAKALDWLVSQLTKP